MCRGFLLLSVTLAAAAGPAAASQAQLLPPAQPDERTTEPAPARPAPKGGRMVIRVRGGLTARRKRYVARGQRVAVIGRVRPFVRRQVVTVYMVRRGRVVRRWRVPIRRSRRGRGRFVVRFIARRAGLVRLVAKHKRTATQRGFRSNSKRVRVVRWRAGRGARGVRVLLLQRVLRRLGFPVPVTGYYGAATARGVLAYRKTNLMGRGRYATRRVYARLFRRRGRFRLRYPRAGRHVEYDWSRQVLVLARRGRAWRVYHSSSGKASTPTVFGTYRFYRKQPGTNANGMVHSSYFIRGYAIHGYRSVPTYPASHGCIRVPIPDAWGIYRWIRRGMLISVYR